jgi:putative pyruvate formate lyase activating enzyme
MNPSYISLSADELKNRSYNAENALSECICCPRQCHTNRKSGKYGICNSGYLPVVSSYTEHFGEEPVISGTKGAGNIFFGNCNLKCIYCQNYEISQNYEKENLNSVSFERVADIMLELQAKGCHNIGLVSPTHFSSQILKSLEIAIKRGLSIPIVYNSNGYDSPEMLKLFDGIVDIYLPDMKYGSNACGLQYSKVPEYFDKARVAIKEMYRQTGAKLVIENGIAIKGLIIRHLVLPNDLSDTEEIFKFISEELSPEVHISLMCQYYPVHKANEEILLSRELRVSEYEKALDLLGKYGLENGWQQELSSSQHYRPSFDSDRNAPFKG